MLKETKKIDGEQHYRLPISKEWVKAHPVPELKEGLTFYASSYPSPCILLRTNRPDHHIEQIIPGMPPKEVGEYWLVFIPSSGSEPLMWFPRDYVEGNFQAGVYRQDPDRRPDYCNNRDYSESWWWPILREDLNENVGIIRRVKNFLGW